MVSSCEADSAALASLYDTHRDYVWRSLRRLAVPDRYLEDLTHDVFVVVQRRWPTFDATRPVRPWLFAIAFREASELRRRASYTRELLPVDDRPPSDTVSSGDDDPMTRRADQVLARRALAAIEPKRRAVLILHDIDGEAVPAIAEAFDIPLNTAYSRLRLARKDFASIVWRLTANEGPSSFEVKEGAR